MYDRTVLFVDDDEIFLQILEMNLQDEAYGKHFATSGAEALDMLRREEVHVMVVDVVMPKMSGLELLRIVTREYPDIVSVVMSAYAQPMDVMRSIVEQGIYRYIPKPWKLDGDFIAVFREVVDSYEIIRKHEDIFAESGHCSDRNSISE